MQDLIHQSAQSHLHSLVSTRPSSGRMYAGEWRCCNFCWRRSQV